MENKFGKVSRVSICAGKKDGRTILEDVSFTAPYKMTTPFRRKWRDSGHASLCIRRNYER